MYQNTSTCHKISGTSKMSEIPSSYNGRLFCVGFSHDGPGDCFGFGPTMVVLYRVHSWSIDPRIDVSNPDALKGVRSRKLLAFYIDGVGRGSHCSFQCPLVFTIFEYWFRHARWSWLKSKILKHLPLVLPMVVFRYEKQPSGPYLISVNSRTKHQLFFQSSTGILTLEKCTVSSVTNLGGMV